MLFIRGTLTGLVGGIIEAIYILREKRQQEIEPAPVVKEI